MNLISNFLIGLFSSIAIGKGLVATGSLGGIFSFFGIKGVIHVRERVFEITSTVKNTDWNSGYVTPQFNSTWLGGGFEKPTKYSYGYIARVEGTDFFEEKNTSKRIRRDLITNTQQEAEARLTLIETVDGRQKAGIETKGSWTPKKFFLVGSNKLTKDIEVIGLVSLIQYGHNGIKSKCGDKTEGQGAILSGLCDKEIFKTNDDSSLAPKFIKEELKDQNGSKRVALMKLKLEDKGLGAVWGQNNNSSSSAGSSGNVIKWSRTGYLYLKEQKKEQVTNVVRKAWTAVGAGGVKGFFVVHDLIFSKEGMGGMWMDKFVKHGNISVEGVKSNSKGQCATKPNKDIRCLNGQQGGEKIIDIPLLSNRNYYIWDPDKTKIKNGKFLTDEGQELPFNLRFNATWNSELIK